MMVIPGIGNAPCAVLLALSLLGGVEVPPQFFSVDDIPINYFNEKRIIYGRVERVIDGDTLRITHCPTYFSCPATSTRKRITDTTIRVRAYGIDSPELQKGDSGSPSQPFARTAKLFTSSFSLDKTVEVKLLDKDQYGRVIGKIKVGSSDLSIELAKRGLASIYTGRGAVYDGNKELMQMAQEFAKEQKLGIWSLGDELVTPAKFKHQLTGGEAINANPRSRK